MAKGRLVSLKGGIQGCTYDRDKKLRRPIGSFQEISYLPYSSTFPDLEKCRDDLPNLLKPESWSSYCLKPHNRGSIPQTDAAASIRRERSATNGRRVGWVCQLSSSSSQTLSERPSSNAFAGFEGFPPPTTSNTTSDEESLPNGSVPVSTCMRRIDVRVHVGHRVVHTWYTTIAIEYMSASFEGVYASSPNLEGTRSSGGAKGVDPA